MFLYSTWDGSFLSCGAGINQRSGLYMCSYKFFPDCISLYITLIQAHPVEGGSIIFLTHTSFWDRILYIFRGICAVILLAVKVI
jgi:hypothetical protein